PMAMPKTAGSTPRSTRTSHHVPARARSACATTPGSFHSLRSRSRCKTGPSPRAGPLAWTPVSTMDISSSLSRGLAEFLPFTAAEGQTSIIRRLRPQKVPHRVHLSRVIGDVKHRVLQVFAVGEAGRAPGDAGVRIGILRLEMGHRLLVHPQQLPAD